MLLQIFTVFIVLAFTYLYMVNRAMSRVPEEVHRLVGPGWTEEEIKSTYKRICEKPLNYSKHLPPKLDRRYVVVGGSGLIGGHIILHLLSHGTPPSHIRNLDLRAPTRGDMVSGPASHVPFHAVDITDPTTLSAAFSAPWPPSAAPLPLTVFHTAALIRPQDSSALLVPRLWRINVDGTKNVVGAAKAAGADVFVATSSASIGVRRARFWAGWKGVERLVQVVGQEDVEMERERTDFLGCYSFTKREAEKVVLGEDQKGFRTGCIRPGNGVYGNEHDLLLGTYLRLEFVPTWASFIAQHFVHAENVSCAHLYMEKALLCASKTQEKKPLASGRTFAVTDPSNAVQFKDVFKLLSTLSITPFQCLEIPPAPTLLLAQLIEWYCLALFRWPGLKRIFPELKAEVEFLQPGVMQCNAIHTFIDDEEARKPIEQGGLGYKAAWTSIEGMCHQLKQWNELQISKSGKSLASRRVSMSGPQVAAKEVANIGAAAGAVRA